MPKSALPKHLQDIENNFPDDDQYHSVPFFGKLYRWFNKATKTWFAFSCRCPEWWARTNICPEPALAINDGSLWRFEEAKYSKDYSVWYLSRIQYWSRWHFTIQWCWFENLFIPIPLISGHWYFKQEYVPKEGGPYNNLDGKLIFFYCNHFDADLIFWLFTSFYIGFNWK